MKRTVAKIIKLNMNKSRKIKNVVLGILITEILKYEKPMKLNHIKDPPNSELVGEGGKEKFYDPIRVSESYERKREDFPQRKRKSR